MVLPQEDVSVVILWVQPGSKAGWSGQLGRLNVLISILLSRKVISLCLKFSSEVVCFKLIGRLFQNLASVARMGARKIAGWISAGR